MKSLLFGNPNTDWWKLSLDDISVVEQVIALTGELSVGFFCASTPMCIPRDVLSRFAAEVHELDRTLKGIATLENGNVPSTIRLKIAVNHVGHLHVSGRYEINDNGLDFQFRSDQTQLTSLGQWLGYVLEAYRKKAA
jgi:hypothetical protein